METYDDFLHKWLNLWISAYGGECVAEVAQFNAERDLPIAYANAKDWADNPALYGAFTWIQNNPVDYNQAPQRGDIVVWSGSLPGSGGYGHVDLYDTRLRAGVFQGLDQNWGGKVVHFQEHTYDYILGWWRLNAVPPPAPEPTPAPNITLEQLTQVFNDLLHRDPDPSGIANYVGNYSYDFVANDIKNSPEYLNQPVPIPPPPAPVPDQPPPLPVPDPHPDPAPDNPVPVDKPPKPIPAPELPKPTFWNYVRKILNILLHLRFRA